MVGDGVHVHVDSAGREPELARVLETAKIPQEEPREVTPGVEDLFVALLGHDAEAP